MHDSFHSLDLRYVFGRSVFVRLTFHLLINSLGTNVDVGSMRFKADKGIMDALVHLRKKRGAGGGGSNCRRASPRDTALRHALC